MIKKRWLALALAIMMVMGLFGGVAVAEDEECPAAPDVAGKILGEFDVDFRYVSGTVEHPRHGEREVYSNYIAEVAQAMTNGAAFPAYEWDGTWDGETLVDKCDEDAYYMAVYHYLMKLGADIPGAYFEPSIDYPATVIAGEDAWVTWTVENTGNTAGEQDIRRGVWRPDGGMHSVVTARDIYLEPGETWTHTARYVLRAVGTYPLELRTDDKTVTAEIVVGPGEPANAEFIYQPADGIVGQALTSDDNGYPAILVTDEYGNPVPGEEVELGLTNIGWNFRRVGTGTDPQVTDADGIATYDDLVFDAPGSYRFTSRVLGTDPLVRANTDWFNIRCSVECSAGSVNAENSSATWTDNGDGTGTMVVTVQDCCGYGIEGLGMDDISITPITSGTEASLTTLHGYNCWSVILTEEGDGFYTVDLNFSCSLPYNNEWDIKADGELITALLAINITE